MDMGQGAKFAQPWGVHSGRQHCPGAKLPDSEACGLRVKLSSVRSEWGTCAGVPIIVNPHRFAPTDAELGAQGFPESISAPNPAVLIAWLRGASYLEVSKTIGLQNLAQLDMNAEVATCQNKLQRSGVSFAFRAALMPRREVARFKPINANQTVEDAAVPERPQKRQRREDYNSGGNRRGLLLSPPAPQPLSNGGGQTLDDNNAIQSRRTSCHQGDPPLHSSLESQSERQSNRQARRLDHAEYCSGSSQSSESQNLRTGDEENSAGMLGDSAIWSARADCHPGDPPPCSSPEYSPRTRTVLGSTQINFQT
ncbi:hypothetical protein B0T25DRAFT_569047 [Lasiosphaeria hispida]|uniref:Uncharacterized protein n=1 Tax=Lasiosphaeria hispida TaxID=260671 RepID=A0AAJ0HJH7_9PEZI|nr:hypothetical protein B0T25DRAFT_569047 [Lasiosphaeria hispida]